MFDLLRYGCIEGEKIGADFCELRFDDLSLRTMIKENEQIKEINLIKRCGIGISTYFKGVVGYSYTAELTQKALREAVKRSFGIAKASSRIAKLKLELDEQRPSKSAKEEMKFRKHPSELSLLEKKEMLDRITSSAKENGKRISSVIGLYGELFGEKMFTNSEGTELSWKTSVVDLRVNVTSKDKAGNLVDEGDGIGGSFGIEKFEENSYTPERLGENAAHWASEKLKAKSAPVGEFKALCENILVGVLAHESFGHLSEADFILTNSSPLVGKIGERIGSEVVTIVDEGVCDSKYQGFYLPFDDQGVRTEKTVIMENGVLRTYLHTRSTAKLLKGKATGNARAINFTFAPIPRMKNTYIQPGDLTEEEALEELHEGIYAIRTAGGQANMDGSFLFKARRGYWIEDGEIKYPLKDVALTGNILEFMGNVEGATRDLEIQSGYFGGCGKGGQFPLPVGLGGPKLLVKKVRFGGESA